MRRAPQRHVLAEDAVPDVVEREADHREAAAQQQQRAAERDAPAGRPLDRRAVARVGAEHRGEEAGQRDAGEAGEDRVVRDVRERPAVAPAVDVRRDVPEEAEGGDAEREEGHQDRQGGPAGHGHDLLGQRRGAADDADAAGAVAEADGKHDRGHHRGDDRRRHEVLHGGAAGGLAGGEERGEGVRDHGYRR
jgi:hypothetical protein